ncbi:AAA family ATPase [Kutzneria albida]|nr:AAA family ATPase [Kutzneria albida]
MGTPAPGKGPRGMFAERFALLYAEAGDPPLKRVTESVARARRVDERGRPLRVPAQRVSDWRRGRNVPARFSALAVVLEVLVGEARKLRAQPVLDGLYDLDDWRVLWEQALASPAVAEAGKAAGPEVQPPPAEEPAEDVSACPYRGLAVFRQEDTRWFFGRERSTSALVARLGAASDTGGIVVLVGASGAGKSSLLRAGLLPALTEGGSGRAVVLVTPTADPVKELARAVPELGAVLGSTAEDGEEGFTTDERFTSGVREALTAFGARTCPGGPRPVLVVDQFEETFTLAQDEAERRAYVELLHAASTAAVPGGVAPALVVLGVRADFYGRCLDYPVLAEALQERQMVLGAMTSAELREAVARPARAVGLQLESGLVDLMLRDLGVSTGRGRVRAGQGAYDAGALPLLSHALLATWQRRQGGRLTVAGYRAAGGIQGAVAATAERAWADLDRAGQEAARLVLLRLVHVGQDSQDTRRRSTRQEVIGQAVSPRPAESALEVLARARLVTLDAESVEITHEALLQAWPRLRGWIDRDRAGNVLRQRIEEDSAGWDAENRDNSLLYRGGRLETALQWSQQAGAAALSAVGRDFLGSSARHRRRMKWFTRSAVLLLVVFALFAATMAAVAQQQRDEAQYAQVVAEADRLAATDPSLSAQLDLVARRLRPEDQAVRSRVLSTQFTPLSSTLAAHRGAVYLTTFSPNGKVLATASYDNTVRLWDVTDRSAPTPIGEPITGFSSWVSSAVFSPDGTVLAAAGDNHLIRLFDVSDPAHPRELGQPLGGTDGTIYLVAFSPDGHTLASADEFHDVRLWDVRDPAHAVAYSPPFGSRTTPVRSVAFSPDGHLLAAGGDDKSVQLWDVRDPANPVKIGEPIGGFGGTVHSVAFSRDGRMLASGCEDGTIRLFDVTNPGQVGALGLPLAPGAGPVWSVAFASTEPVLASSGSDGAARLWNIADPTEPEQLGPALASGSSQFAVGFNPDDSLLAVGANEGTVRLWSLPEQVLVRHGRGPGPIVYQPGGKLLATGSPDGTVGLWDTSDQRDPKPLGPPLATGAGGADKLAFSRDGRLLAATTSDKQLQLWNLTDPVHPTRWAPPIPLGTRYSSSLALSPDGRLLAADVDDANVQLWDISDRTAPRKVGAPMPSRHGYIYAAAFSSDSRTLFTGYAANDIQAWDLSDPTHPHPRGPSMRAHGGGVLAFALSPDGRVLATGGEDKQVRLWDVTDPTRLRPLGPSLDGYTKGIPSLSFSADGHVLATGSGDQSIRLWDVSNPAAPAPIGSSLAARPGTYYTVALSPGGGTVASFGEDKAVRLWDLDPAHAESRICAVTRGVLTEQVWHLHLPQLAYNPPCG